MKMLVKVSRHVVDHVPHLILSFVELLLGLCFLGFVDHCVDVLIDRALYVWYVCLDTTVIGVWRVDQLCLVIVTETTNPPTEI